MSENESQLHSNQMEKNPLHTWVSFLVILAVVILIGADVVDRMNREAAECVKEYGDNCTVIGGAKDE